MKEGRTAYGLTYGRTEGWTRDGRTNSFIVMHGTSKKGNRFNDVWDSLAKTKRYGEKELKNNATQKVLPGVEQLKYDSFNQLPCIKACHRTVEKSESV